MHTGSRAFCFLMALAATGAECASAAVPVSTIGAGHYRVEAKPVAGESIVLPSAMIANHVLAVIAVGHVMAAPAATTSETAANQVSQPIVHAQPFAVWDASCSFDLPAPVSASQVYDADGRRLASLADANERQLLFVKITRG